MNVADLLHVGITAKRDLVERLAVGTDRHLAQLDERRPELAESFEGRLRTRMLVGGDHLSVLILDRDDRLEAAFLDGNRGAFLRFQRPLVDVLTRESFAS